MLSVLILLFLLFLLSLCFRRSPVICLVSLMRITICAWCSVIPELLPSLLIDLMTAASIFSQALLRFVGDCILCPHLSVKR